MLTKATALSIFVIWKTNVSICNIKKISRYWSKLCRCFWQFHGLIFKNIDVALQFSSRTCESHLSSIHSMKAIMLGFRIQWSHNLLYWRCQSSVESGKRGRTSNDPTIQKCPLENTAMVQLLVEQPFVEHGDSPHCQRYFGRTRWPTKLRSVDPSPLNPWNFELFKFHLQFRQKELFDFPFFSPIWNHHFQFPNYHFLFWKKNAKRRGSRNWTLQIEWIVFVNTGIQW